MSTRVILCALILMLLLPSELVAAKPEGNGKGGSKPGGGGKPASDSVTSVVHDCCLWVATDPDNPNIVELVDHKIRSDFKLRGTNTYYDGVDGVISILPDYYQLNLHSSTVRTMYVDFGEPANGSEPVPPEVVGGSAGYVAAKLVGRPGGVAAMTGVGTSVTGGFPFAFTGHDGMYYQLRMNSENEPGTGDATFTCTAVDGADQGDASAPCVAWRVVPASPDGKIIGRLYRQSKAKGKVTYTELGDYFVSYEITFTN